VERRLIFAGDIGGAGKDSERMSDVISLHAYSKPGEFDRRIVWLQPYNQQAVDFIRAIGGKN
jgi:hypothetical protein